MCVCVCVIINIKVHHKILPQLKTNYSWFLYFSINQKKKKKKKHNIKNRKLNYSLYTKKTNNTNELMQISYHSAFTKIQIIQN